MAQERGTDKKFAKDNERIAEALSRRERSARVPAQPTRGNRPTIPTVLGTGFERGTGTDGGTGAGIISPVTEPSAATRQYFSPPRTITSTDGVFTIEVRDLRSIDMEDADGNEVQFVLAQP